jgi:hypothetical protein
MNMMPGSLSETVVSTIQTKYQVLESLNLHVDGSSLGISQHLLQVTREKIRNILAVETFFLHLTL